MRTNSENRAAKCEYLRPEVEFADVIVERGFSASIEYVGKDEEIEF